MEQKSLELFLQNYQNQGLCEGLDKFIKKIEKEFKKSGTKKTINYLPWAVVEKIFRLQGGTIEVVDWKFGVDFDSQGYNAETGEIEQGTKSALFVKLKGTWQGEELEEYYPIFDNQTSRVIKTPDAQQLNTSRQRGSVRLIARLSGIGLWIFEQQDGQFDDDDDDVIKPIVKGNEKDKEPVIAKDKSSKKEEKVVKEKAPKEDPKVEDKVEDKPKKKDNDKAMIEALGGAIEEENQDENIANMFLGGIIKNDEPKDEKPRTPIIKEQKEDYANDSEEHSDLLLKVKSYVKTHKDVILAFRNEKGRELLGDLTYSELKELLEKLK